MSDGLQTIRIESVAGDEMIDAAYLWLCYRRQKQQHNADIWDLHWRWKEEKTILQQSLRAGTYRLSSLDWFLNKEGELIELYSARDALVLKALTLALTSVLLPHLSPACSHVKGHGGIHGALRRVKTMLPWVRFVCRSDVRGFYANINHERLEQMLDDYIDDPLEVATPPSIEYV